MPDDGLQPSPQLPPHVSVTVAPLAYVPALQSRQTASETAPVTGEYFPAPQLLHTVLPCALEYFPTIQSRHDRGEVAPTVAKNFPAAHSLQTLAPEVVPYFPAPQSSHSTDAGLAANLPAGHDTQP